MTFAEYLLAIGNEVAAGYATLDPSEVGEGIQRRLLTELKTYFFVGGMPESVRAYAATSSLVESFRVQTEIIGTYRDDFAKYRPRVDRDCIDAVPLVLRMACVVHKVPSSDPSGLPLGAGANPRRFKAAMLDIGMLPNLCQIPADLELRQDNLLAMYRGKLAEQFVAQELIAHHSSELFYWAREARGSSAEVDFLAARGGEVVPVEVKSGAGGSLRSLHRLLDTYPNCREGVVLYSGTFAHREEQRLTFLPLYYAGPVGDPRPEVV